MELQYASFIKKSIKNHSKFSKNVIIFRNYLQRSNDITIPYLKSVLYKELKMFDESFVEFTNCNQYIKQHKNKILKQFIFSLFLFPFETLQNTIISNLSLISNFESEKYLYNQNNIISKYYVKKDGFLHDKLEDISKILHSTSFLIRYNSCILV